MSAAKPEETHSDECNDVKGNPPAIEEGGYTICILSGGRTQQYVAHAASLLNGIHTRNLPEKKVSVIITATDATMVKAVEVAEVLLSINYCFPDPQKALRGSPRS